nr:PREDICTED: cell cycle and apoptosis regulator protein 2 isoform X1 [Lepisosteus oculatus]XP_015197735.1 PREDICTED: cell cycle and apoptosis regulator protein 2 isoform X1 [Lepisosteus oculatus]XP_015197745.1 PREDICTED: cell cycle and apoptosis regulator protein 2 isoform X1 [Lepisosteus oculatus]XP_015197753.1 PREDICTED: cell cycle and apoptosis regulator protein 2 isoform X1 [Lepisosteus oculatus]XP_015197768.1 PREDICTED: cell cycle and apoptosis regulator protein 2 isoform X1 [Lepisosteus 
MSSRANHKTAAPALLGHSPGFVHSSAGMEATQAPSLLQNPQLKQRVFTGVVTQLQDYYGMVDEEVQFQMSVVKGRLPQVGEKVLVTAVLDPAVSQSWTAQKVQALNSQLFFKSPPPLLPSMSSGQKQGILGNKPRPLLQDPMIPPLLPSMQQATPKPGLLQTPSHMPSWGGHFEPWTGGRKRHSEGSGRRGSRWEDGGWGGDSQHQKRRRWRGTQEEGPQKKTNVRTPRYWPLFSRFSRDSSACDTMEVLRRYPQLSIPDAFFHLRLSWVDTFPPSRPLTLGYPCPFYQGSPQPEAELTHPTSTNTTYSTKVLLLSMPSLEEIYRQCCSLSQDNKEPAEGAVHPTALIKFVVGIRGGEERWIGGPWSPSEDGANPAKEPQVLVRTAVRWAREQAGLDLSGCSQWFKLAELRYLRGGHVETTVFFLPDVWHSLPGRAEWEALRAVPDAGANSDATEGHEQQCETEPAVTPLPEEPGLVLRPCEGLSLTPLPLAALLEPRNSTSEEAFEVGLMAELFNEILQRDFGLQIYRALSAMPPGAGEGREREDVAMKEEKPGKAESGSGKKAGGERRTRRRRGGKERESTEDEEEKTDEEDDEKPEEGEEKTAESVMTVEEAETKSAVSNHSEEPASKDAERPPGWQAMQPPFLLLSFLYFDQQLSGQLAERDLEEILHSLGLHFTRAQARELVSRAVLGGVCRYRTLAARWEDTDPSDPEPPGDDSNLQGNRALLPGSGGKAASGSSRRSGTGSSDVVTHRGTVLNIANLLASLEKAERTRVWLEDRVARLAEVEAREAKREAEQAALSSELSAAQTAAGDLRGRLERAEKRNAAYERSLKENAGHMIAVIEKMQKLVDKTTNLAESRTESGEKE